MRKLLLLQVGFLLAFFSVQAQDVLVKKNGKTVEGKVTEVGVTQVFYKISEEPNSALFIIRKSELSRIEFANGQTVFMGEREPRENAQKDISSESFGRNFVNFSPFKALDSGPGFGVSYEVLVDKRGLFGIILPFTMTIPESYMYIIDSDNDNTQMYYFSPGLKIYPFGQRKVTYAVGPNIFTSVGHQWRYQTDYNPTTGVYTNRDGRVNTFRLGMIVNNYVNFQVTRNFQIGLNAGLGSRYVEKETFNSITTRQRGIRVTGEFNFNLGLRF